MNRMGRKLEYSLMALKHMAQKNSHELTSAKEVADSYQAPFDATARVLQQMAQKGLVKSEQGAHGGYKITKDLSQVTLQELIEIVQGPPTVAKCLSDESCEMQHSCNIISPVAILDRKLTDFYKGISLKELLMR